MTGPQPPQEHCGHEFVCRNYARDVSILFSPCEDPACVYDTRTRSSPAAAPVPDSEYFLISRERLIGLREIYGIADETISEVMMNPAEQIRRQAAAEARAEVSNLHTCEHKEIRNDVEFCHYHDAMTNIEQIRRQAAVEELGRVLDAAITMLTDGLEDMPATTIPEVRQGKIDAIEWAVEKLESLRKPQEPQQEQAGER